MARVTLPFDRQCQLTGLPVPVAEHRFHPTRRWRFDWAFLDHKLAVEVEGAAFMPGGGRHTRGAGFRKDTEKYAEALIAGWRVLRVMPEHIANGRALTWVDRIIRKAA